MYAIVETGGKQYTVSPGDRVRFEKLPGEVGNEVELDRVLLVSDGDEVAVGTPTLSGAKVTGTILAHGRGRKQIVYKLRRRTNYRRKQGHRQCFTEVHVTGITS